MCGTESPTGLEFLSSQTVCESHSNGVQNKVKPSVEELGQRKGGCNWRRKILGQEFGFFRPEQKNAQCREPADGLAGALTWRCRYPVSCWTIARSQISRHTFTCARSRPRAPRVTASPAAAPGRPSCRCGVVAVPLSFSCETCVIVRAPAYALRAVTTLSTAAVPSAVTHSIIPVTWKFLGL